MNISILTPTIKGRDWFLLRCANSVEAQTYGGDIEHVIFKGDGVAIPAAFQACLENARGEYVMPLADDDWIAPHACELLAHALDRGADVACAKSVITNPQGSRVASTGGALMWRKELTDRIGGFDPRFAHAGDTDLYLRMVEAGAEIVYASEALYFATEHSQHNAYLHADELAVELAEIERLYPRAKRKLEMLSAKRRK